MKHKYVAVITKLKNDVHKYQVYITDQNSKNRTIKFAPTHQQSYSEILEAYGESIATFHRTAYLENHKDTLTFNDLFDGGLWTYYCCWLYDSVETGLVAIQNKFNLEIIKVGPFPHADFTSLRADNPAESSTDAAAT